MTAATTQPIRFCNGPDVKFPFASGSLTIGSDGIATTLESADGSQSMVGALDKSVQDRFHLVLLPPGELDGEPAWELVGFEMAPGLYVGGFYKLPDPGIHESDDVGTWVSSPPGEYAIDGASGPR